MESNTTRVALCLTFVFPAVFFIASYIRRRTPDKWIKIGEVSHLRVYPLKSGKGTAAEKVECTEHGVKLGEARDRMFMVVDLTGKFISGRDYPRMIQIVAQVVDGRLTLSGPDSESPVDVDLPEDHGDPIQTKIWSAAAEGIDCGDEVAIWLSEYLLGEKCGLRLLYRAEHLSGKDFNPGMKKWRQLSGVIFRRSDAGLFSDTFSYHLVTESSVDDLNGRIQDGGITPFHFRPNIVVRGEKLIPYEEDRWRWVKIGDVIFQFLAPCMRCSFTTIDPEIGERSRNLQPLTSLRRYRMVRDAKEREIIYTPTMGVYLGVRQTGTINVGDGVFVADE